MHATLPLGSSVGLILTTIDAAFTAAGLTPSIDGSAVRTVSFGSVVHTYSLASVSNLAGTLSLGGVAIDSGTTTIPSLGNYKITVVGDATSQQVWLSFTPVSGVSIVRAVGKQVSSITTTANAQSATALSYLVANSVAKGGSWSMLAGAAIHWHPSLNKPIVVLPAADFAGNTSNIATFEATFGCKVLSSEGFLSAPRALSTAFYRPDATSLPLYSNLSPGYGWSTAFATLIPRKYTFHYGDTLQDCDTLLTADWGMAGLSQGDTLTLGGFEYVCWCVGHLARSGAV